MKIVTTICDKCGKEIVGTPYWIQTGLDEEEDDETYRDRDFCSECIEEMRRFMLPEKPKATVKRKVGRPAKED